MAEFNYYEIINRIANFLLISPEALAEIFKGKSGKLGGEQTDRAENDAQTSSCLICFYPHIHADGDALGSCLALALVMEKLGYEVAILASEKYLENLHQTLPADLERFYFYEEEDIRAFGSRIHLAIRLDSSADDRLANRLPYFEAMRSLGLSITVDHHEASSLPLPQEEQFYLRYEKASATCELVTALIDRMQINSSQELFDDTVASALMLGLITDTGRFSYSNVSSETFKMASILKRYEVNIPAIVNPLFDEKSIAAIRLRGRIFSQLRFYAENRLAIVSLTYADMQSFNANSEALDGIVAELRCIKGVELAIVLRSLLDGSIKASLRSSETYDCNKLAKFCGGGGHIRASGFTLARFHPKCEERNARGQAIRLAAYNAELCKALQIKASCFDRKTYRNRKEDDLEFLQELERALVNLWDKDF